MCLYSKGGADRSVYAFRRSCRNGWGSTNQQVYGHHRSAYADGDSAAHSETVRRPSACLLSRQSPAFCGSGKDLSAYCSGAPRAPGSVSVSHPWPSNQLKPCQRQDPVQATVAVRLAQPSRTSLSERTKRREEEIRTKGMKLISDSSLRLRPCVGGGGAQECDICDSFESVTGINGVFCLREAMQTQELDV